MNKKKFLKELEDRLDVLKEEEKKDILDEYASHIDQKVKNGKTEQEAVKDFGDIDDLASEILDAYKIKKDYKKKEIDPVEKYVNKFVDVLKEVFQSISRSINEDTLGFIFKLLIVLIAIGFLKIPFYIIEHIGRGIFGALTFYPLDKILIILWVVLVEIAYIVTSFMFAFTILKSKNDQNKKSTIVEEKKSKNEKSGKKEKSDEKVKKEDKKKEINEEKKTDEKIVKKNDSSIQNVSTVILKTFAIMIIIPFIFTMIGLVIGLGVIIKLAFEGIVIISAIGILAGLILLTGAFIDLVFRVVFTHGRLGFRVLFSTIVGLILLGFGSASLVFDFVDVKYVDEMPKNDYVLYEKEYSYKLNDSFTFNYNYGHVELFTDDSLNTDEIKIKVKYYDDLVDINITDLSSDEVTFDIDGRDYKYSEIRNFYDMFKRDLKDDKVYNYSLLFKPKYEIYVNSTKTSSININRID